MMCNITLVIKKLSMASLLFFVVVHCFEMGLNDTTEDFVLLTQEMWVYQLAC